MNRSVDNRPGTETAELTTTAPRSIGLWLTAAGLIGFTLIKYGVAMRTEYILVSALSLALAFFLGVYLYRDLLGHFSRGRGLLLGGAGLIALMSGMAVTHPEYITMMAANVITLLAASALVGRRARVDSNRLRLYLIGFTVVAAGGTAMLAGQWPLLMDMVRQAGTEMAASVRDSASLLGYHPEAAETMSQRVVQSTEAMARVMPSFTVLNLIIQFTLGFLWFLTRTQPGDGSKAHGVVKFGLWKAPFGLAPILIALVLARILGGEFIRLVADNLLLVLSIYYCVAGLAVAQHALRRFKVSLPVRILFYVFLVLTGLLGYLLTVLLGFVDSFADWRKVAIEPVDLAKR